MWLCESVHLQIYRYTKTLHYMQLSIFKRKFWINPKFTTHNKKSCSYEFICHYQITGFFLSQNMIMKLIVKWTSHDGDRLSLVVLRVISRTTGTLIGQDNLVEFMGKTEVTNVDSLNSQMACVICNDDPRHRRLVDGLVLKTFWLILSSSHILHENILRIPN